MYRPAVMSHMMQLIVQGLHEPRETNLWRLPLHTVEGEQQLLHAMIQIHPLPRPWFDNHPSSALVCVAGQVCWSLENTPSTAQWEGWGSGCAEEFLSVGEKKKIKRLSILTFLNYRKLEEFICVGWKLVFTNTKLPYNYNTSSIWRENSMWDFSHFYILSE